MKTELYVVSHKRARMPQEKIYLPLQVGPASENFPGFLRDNTEINIASKNGSYCELTAQYWAAKNRKADIKGLVHYRRFFSNGSSHFFSTVNQKFANVLSGHKLDKIMSEYDMILPKKRNYYIETSWSHYEHVHHIEDLQITRDVLVELYPEYVPFFDQTVNRKSAHMFNMLIAKANIFDEYTDWLIKVLSEVEKRTNITDYTPYEKRLYGFLGELLLDMWVEKNQIKYTELPVMFMGKQHWIKKIASFLWRKFRGNPNDR